MLILCLLPIVIGCATPPERRPIEDTKIAIEVALGGETMNGVAEYGICEKAFYSFIKTPSIDILLQDKEVIICVFSKSTTSAGIIKRETIGGDSNRVDEFHSGFFRLGDDLTPVHESLLDFAGDKEEIMKYLNQNGVTGQIENLAVIATPRIPVVIWVQVDQENYFITIDDQYDIDVLPNIHKTTYVYRFYTHTAYLDTMRCSTQSHKTRKALKRTTI